MGAGHLRWISNARTKDIRPLWRRRGWMPGRTSIVACRNRTRPREGDGSIARLLLPWHFRFRIRDPHGQNRAGRICRSVHSEARRNSRWNRLRQDRRDVLSWPFRQPGIYARVSFACSEEPPAHLAPTELTLFKGRAVRPPRGGGYRPSRHRSNLRVAPMIEATTAEFAIAVMLDLIIGDPRWLPHPVEGIGFLVRRFERLLRRIMPYERAAGSVLVFMVLSVSLVFTAATLRWGRSPVAVYWIFSCLALRSLDQHALESSKPCAPEILMLPEILSDRSLGVTRTSCPKMKSRAPSLKQLRRTSATVLLRRCSSSPSPAFPAWLPTRRSTRWTP